MSDESIQDRLAEVLAGGKGTASAKVSTAVVVSVVGLNTRCILAGDASVQTPVKMCYGVDPEVGDQLVVVGMGGRWYGVGNVTRGQSAKPADAQGPDTCPLMGGTATAWRVGDLCSVRFNAQVTYDVDQYADVMPEALRSWLTNQARTPAGIDMLVLVYNGWFLSYGTVDDVRTWRLWNIERAVSAGEYIVGTVCFANVPA